MAIKQNGIIRASDVNNRFNTFKDIVNNIIVEVTPPIKWTLISQSIFTDNDTITTICYGDGKFIACTARGELAYSPQKIFIID